ncbi:MAG TPA: large conductance mechanosensitive channel protein MscL [Terracidiphilus sp.]|nr:large conductance mechanosensitive channel protein MscL [Terracidiphilus sp.]
MLKGFRDFILRGNVVDLAVAVILGAAFNAIVGSLVKDLLNPLIAATIGKPDFSAVVLHLGSGVIQIGNFLNSVVAFLIIAGVVYFVIVVPMNAVTARMKKPEAAAAPATKACGECLSEIPAAARRCAHCAQPVA